MYHVGRCRDKHWQFTSGKMIKDSNICNSWWLQRDHKTKINDRNKRMLWELLRRAFVYHFAFSKKKREVSKVLLVLRIFRCFENDQITSLQGWICDWCTRLWKMWEKNSIRWFENCDNDAGKLKSRNDQKNSSTKPFDIILCLIFVFVREFIKTLIFWMTYKFSNILYYRIVPLLWDFHRIFIFRLSLN